MNMEDPAKIIEAFSTDLNTQVAKGLSLLPLRTQRLFALDCVEWLLPLFEQKSGETIPFDVVEKGRAFLLQETPAALDELLRIKNRCRDWNSSLYGMSDFSPVKRVAQVTLDAIITLPAPDGNWWSEDLQSYFAHCAEETRSLLPESTDLQRYTLRKEIRQFAEVAQREALAAHYPALEGAWAEEVEALFLREETRQCIERLYPLVTEEDHKDVLEEAKAKIPLVVDASRWLRAQAQEHTRSAWTFLVRNRRMKTLDDWNGVY